MNHRWITERNAAESDHLIDGGCSLESVPCVFSSHCNHIYDPILSIDLFSLLVSAVFISLLEESDKE